MGSSVNKIILIIFAGLIAAGIWFIAIPYVKDLQKSTLKQTLAIELNSADRKPVSLTIGSSTLMVDLAVSEDEQERGLGQRNDLAPDKGMLFVFNAPEYATIWMKDMLFPIDIAWLDKDFRVITIKSNVYPNTYPKTFGPDAPASYVLEVNAGYFAAHGVSVGDTVQ